MAPKLTNVTDTAHITFRLPASLAEALEQMAKDADRSLSAELRRAVKAHVEEYEPEKSAA